MGLKTVVEKVEDLEEVIRPLYVQKDGKYILDIEDLNLHPEVKKLRDENGARRIAAKQLEDKLKPFEGLNLAEIQEKLDRLPELEAAAAGKLDEAKMGELVEVRLKSRIAPLEREKKTLAETNEALRLENEGLKQQGRQRIIDDEIRKAATISKIVPEALEDALLLGSRVFEIDEAGKVVVKDGVGYTPGIAASSWFTDLQSKRPHWWGPSSGAGAQGSKGGNGFAGANPFTHDGWNMTQQGALVRTDPVKAEQLAKIAGTSIGGQRPPAKK